MEMIPKSDHEAAVAEARAAATTEERGRIAAIVNSEAAAKRPVAALKLALSAGVTPELAATLLDAVQPEASSTQPSYQFSGQRSQDAPGGLAVVDSAPGMSQPTAPSTDFARGRAVAQKFKNVQP